MTTEIEQLRQATTHLQRMYEALAHLRARTGGTGQFLLLSEGPLEEIRRLEETVAQLSGRAAAEWSEADVWLQVSGDHIVWPAAPTSVLTHFLDTMRKGIQSAAEWIVTGQLSTRPTKEIRSACDLRVVAIQPGSVRVGVQLPQLPQIPKQASLDFGSAEPTRPTPAAAALSSLQKYLAVAGWAGSEDAPDSLASLVDDADLRRLLLTEVKRLVPRLRGDVQSVAFYGRLVERFGTVSLTRDVHKRIDAAIDLAEQEDVVEHHVGDLREIDLDNRSFTLRNVGDGAYQVQCQFSPDLYDSALDALDRKVEVTGVRRTGEGRGRGVRLTVTRLDIVDEEKDPPAVKDR